MSTAEASSAPSLATTSALRGLNHLSLLTDATQRDKFFPAVADLLTAAPGTNVSAQLAEADFALDFSDGAASALLHSTKVLLCGVASRAYEDGGSEALQAELLATGMGEGAAV